MKLFIKALLPIICLALTLTDAYAQDASFSVDNSTGATGCSPKIVKFNSVQGGAYTHSWDFGNSGGWVNNAPKDPTHTYTTPGTYTVKHKVSGSGGQDIVTKTNYITVYPKPTISFSASPLNGCAPLLVHFTNNSNPGTSGTPTYSWVLGSGASPGTSSAKNPVAIYTSGPNDVTLKVTNSKGCFDAVTKLHYINVLPRPGVDFSANKTDFCSAPAAVNFSPAITGSATGPYSYSWDFGDGSTQSTAANPSHTYAGPAPASYTVTLTVTGSNGCSKTTTKTNYINIHNPIASFSGPSIACMYENVTFKNTGSTATGTVYRWTFGDGGISSAKDGIHAYSSPGTYTVRLTTSIGGCSDTKSKQIVIRPRNRPKILPDSLCPAPQLVTYYTDPSVTVDSWLIDTGGGVITSTAAAPTHLYLRNGFYPVVLRYRDGNGCKDTISKLEPIFPLNIQSKVNGRITHKNQFADSGCVPFKVYFETDIYRDSSLPYPYPAISYKWHFGDGDSSSQHNPTHTYTDSGNFMITVDVKTMNGCMVSDTMFIKAGYKPSASFTASPLVSCPKKVITFTGTGPSYDTVYYKWDYGDGAKGITDTPSSSHVYSCLGVYSISLTSSHKGCIDTFVRHNYVEVLAPCAKIGGRRDCNNRLKVSFTDASIGDSSNIWFFGDGTSSTAKNPVHIYPSYGTYSVMLAVYNSTTHCHDTAYKSVWIGEDSLALKSDRTELCTYEDTIKFYTYYAASGGLVKKDWWYINGQLVDSMIDTLTHVFPKKGIYSVKVVSIDGDGCSYEKERINWITVGRPEAGFITDTLFACQPDTITFTDTSLAGPGTTIARRFWYFGTSPSDTLTTTAAQVRKFYTQKGDYDVFLKVFDNIGCADSVYKNNHIHVLKPDADFLVSSPLCIGGEAAFSDISVNAVKYRWDFGDGTIDSTVGTVKHVYNTMGVFYPQLIIADSMGCTDTSAIDTVVTTQPVADFTISDSIAICPPLLVTFDASVSKRAHDYDWDLDDSAGRGHMVRQTVVYNNMKNYHIKLIVTDSIGCKDSITKSVQVLGYAGAFDYDVHDGCVPLTVNFTSLIQGYIPTVLWDFGDGNTVLGSYTQPKVTYTYNTPGKYLPRMVFNNGKGCNIGSEGLDTIIVDKTIADFETGPPCQYSTVQFINKSTTVDGPINVNNWTFEDGSFSALKDPKRNYGHPGKYKVKLYVVNTRGCKDSIEKEITIYPPDPVDAGGDTIICLTDSVQLHPTGGVSYLWSPGSSLSCTKCNEPYASPDKKTVYTVVSTDKRGCHDTTDVTVDIKTHVESIVGKGGEICDGEKFSLHVSGARTYLWDPTDHIDDQTSSDPVATPDTTTNYRVIAYEGRCIPDTSYAKIVVHPRPKVSIRGEAEIVAGTSADLLASGENIVRFLWEPFNTLSCSNCADPVASPYKTTTYTVIVHSKYECVDSAKVTVRIKCDESQLFVPNTFTPNGDGMNDIFMVRGAGISNLKSFRVYNRWGQVLFERSNVQVNDKNSGWDGSFNGTKLPPDVYVYTVEAYCENGDLLKLKGDVTIIR